MSNLAEARRMMVEGQIRTNQVTAPGIISAMLAVPRERFVPQAWRALAYSDRPLPLVEDHAGRPGRVLLEPMIFGKLLQAAEVQPSDAVLHVGCGTGYGSAILARLAGSVVALEEDGVLARTARETLAALGVANATVVEGALASGHPAGAPYDVIVLEGAVEALPELFAAQLKPEGRLVAIVGPGRSGRGTLYRRAGDALGGFPIFDAAAPVLPGFAAPPSFVF